MGTNCVRMRLVGEVDGWSRTSGIATYHPFWISSFRIVNDGMIFRKLLGLSCSAACLSGFAVQILEGFVLSTLITAFLLT